jgi:hypothetical protein
MFLDSRHVLADHVLKAWQQCGNRRTSRERHESSRASTNRSARHDGFLVARDVVYGNADTQALCRVHEIGSHDE